MQDASPLDGSARHKPEPKRKSSPADVRPASCPPTAELGTSPTKQAKLLSSTTPFPSRPSNITPTVTLLTKGGKDVAGHLNKLLYPDSYATMAYSKSMTQKSKGLLTSSKDREKDSDDGHPDEESNSFDLGSNHDSQRPTNLPKITMMLKQKSPTKKANQSRNESKKGVVRAAGRHDAEGVGDNAGKLEEALSVLRNKALTAGFVVNTQRLWRQSNFIPPDHRSSAIRTRQNDFKDWREEAFQAYQNQKQDSRIRQAALEADKAVKPAPQPASADVTLEADQDEEEEEAGFVPVPSIRESAPETAARLPRPRRPRSPGTRRELSGEEARREGLALGDDLSMRSPRDMTEDQAAVAGRRMKGKMLGLQRRVNQLRSERVEKERVLKEWTAMKTGTARLVFLVAKGEELDVEETEVARRLAELEEVIQHEEKERRTREHVVRRLETVIARTMSEATLTPRGDVTRDEEDLKAMQRQFKHHAEDLEKLRVKLQQEHPKLEKGLLANDLIEAKVVMDSVRHKYRDELERRRDLVRQNAKVRQEMLHAEEKEKHLGAELRQLYDPSVNSPRRSELKKKLRVYEETFAMMMSRLGDTSVDRIAALFIQMKGSRLSWEDAVRDAEARCEELRRERSLLQTALKNAFDRDVAASQGDLQRRIRELEEVLKLKEERMMHSKGQIRHANELVAFLRSGVMTALKRLQNVDESSQAHQARAEDGSTPAPLFVSNGAQTNPEDPLIMMQNLSQHSGDADQVEDEVMTLMYRWEQALSVILEVVEEHGVAEQSNFRGFSPFRVFSACGTPDHPITHSIPAQRGPVRPKTVAGDQPAQRGRSGVVWDGEGGGRGSRGRSLGHSPSKWEEGEGEGEAGARLGEEGRVTRKEEGAEEEEEEEEEGRLHTLQEGEEEPGPDAEALVPTTFLSGRGGFDMTESGGKPTEEYEADGEKDGSEGDERGRSLSEGEDEEPEEDGEERQGVSKPSKTVASGEARRSAKLQTTVTSEEDQLSDTDSIAGPSRKPKVVAGLEDLGLFNEDEMAEAVRSITWPHKSLQRRVHIPNKILRKDRRKGEMIMDFSDSDHSTSSATSFDYDEIVEELEQVYIERDGIKKRATRFERHGTAGAAKRIRKKRGPGGKEGEGPEEAGHA